MLWTEPPGASQTHSKKMTPGTTRKCKSYQQYTLVAVERPEELKTTGHERWHLVGKECVDQRPSTHRG